MNTKQDNPITLYHGSAVVIEKPVFGKGSRYNDYGPGFYCTESAELAKEWACLDLTGGFANRYRFAPAGLHILNLNSGEYGILEWLALLAANRTFSTSATVARQAKAYLLEFFLPDVSAADVIVGYRADDSYFTFASDFLSNTISLRKLGIAMRLGRLGEQVMLKSRKAFGAVVFEV